MAAGRRLARALVAAAARDGVTITITAQSSREWRSLTFAGERHVVEAEAQGAALGDWLESLDAQAIRVPGHLLAELRVRDCAEAAQHGRVTLEGLTVALD